MSSHSWPSCYEHWPNLSKAIDAVAVRPIRWSDRESIREWRNQQIDVLRQQDPISTEQQDQYFSQILEPLMGMTHPSQFLFGIELDARLIGYGGLTNIDWGANRAELSFLVDSKILKTPTYKEIMLTFIQIVSEFAKKQFGLKQIFTETYTQRVDHIEILELAGFEHQTFLSDRAVVNGKSVGSQIHYLQLV
jgi:RimJ/RimL family protein N-acetyltransferase